MNAEHSDLGFRKATASAMNGARASAQKRRERIGVEPHVATSERDYSESELDFLEAIEAYKTRSGRKFPSWTEVLSVVREIGYVKPM